VEYCRKACYHGLFLQGEDTVDNPEFDSGRFPVRAPPRERDVRGLRAALRKNPIKQQVSFIFF